MNLAESARPQTLTEFAGHRKAVDRVHTVLAQGWGGRAWWISGAAGTGKTTLARLIAAEGADEWGTEELDAQRLTPARIEELEKSLNYRAFSGRPGKAFIINEAHGLRRDALRLLLTLVETRLPAHVCFIFTTTKAGQKELFDDKSDAQALLSRCTVLTLHRDTATIEAMAQRALEVARKAGLDGKPIADYRKLVSEHEGNLRAVLADIEAGRMADDWSESAPF